jgi:predicted nucleotidyltransferase
MRRREVTAGDGKAVLDLTLLARRRQQLQKRLEVHSEIQFAYLHGSALEDLPYHDLDVALYLEPEHPAAGDSFDYEMQLSVELTQALGFPVDVRVLNRASLGFQHSAIQGDLLLNREDDHVSDFVEDVGRRYMEFAHLGRAYLLEVLKG